MTDMELAGDAGRGDGDAFAEIVRRHDDRLRRRIDRLLPFGRATDDVMQEVYLRAFRALPRFRGDASLKTWLYCIASNACVDHLRRRKVIEVPGEDWPEPVWSGSDPGDIASTGDVVTRALALSSCCRHVGRLRRLELRAGRRAPSGDDWHREVATEPRPVPAPPVHRRSDARRSLTSRPGNPYLRRGEAAPPGDSDTGPHSSC